MTTTSLAQDVSIHQKQVNSLSHNPFQVFLGFQPLTPIDITLVVASSLIDSSHTQTKENCVSISLEWIQHLQQVHDTLPHAKYK
jgi:hypothetical protein